MVGYGEYTKGYKLFDPSSQNKFIERSVQIEEELMQEVELAHGECSHPPLHDDVSDDVRGKFTLKHGHEQNCMKYIYHLHHLGV